MLQVSTDASAAGLGFIEECAGCEEHDLRLCVHFCGSNRRAHLTRLLHFERASNVICNKTEGSEFTRAFTCRRKYLLVPSMRYDIHIHRDYIGILFSSALLTTSKATI